MPWISFNLLFSKIFILFYGPGTICDIFIIKKKYFLWKIYLLLEKAKEHLLTQSFPIYWLIKLGINNSFIFA